MNETSEKDWRQEFGIDGEEGKSVANKAEIFASGIDASQGHVLRRAFDLLRLAGILSAQNLR